MTYIKINDIIYPATINGILSDPTWDGRAVKTITLQENYEIVNAIFMNDSSWSIIVEDTVITYDENGNEIHELQTEEYDNSEFCIRGDLTLHIDGSCTVRMGKPTDLEDAYEILYGGI